MFPLMISCDTTVCICHKEEIISSIQGPPVYPRTRLFSSPCQSIYANEGNCVVSCKKVINGEHKASRFGRLIQISFKANAWNYSLLFIPNLISVLLNHMEAGVIKNLLSLQIFSPASREKCNWLYHVLRDRGEDRINISLRMARVFCRRQHEARKRANWI